MFGFRILVVVSLAASLLMIGVGMTVALLPRRVLDLSGSLQDVGYLASVFALSYLLLLLPLGRLADRLGAWAFLVLGYLLCCVSGLVFFRSGSPEDIFLGRFIQGAGEAPVWALGPALLSLAYPQAKGRAIGIYNAAIHSGLALGPLLGVLLLSAEAAGLPFLVFAALCLCGGATVLLFLPRRTAASGVAVGAAPGLRELAGLLRLRGPALTLCGTLLYGAGYGVFISVLPASLTLSKGFDALSTGLFFTLFYVAISVAQLVAGPLSDRRGRQATMIAGLVMAAVGFASFAPFGSPWVYAPLTLASLGLGVFCVASLADLADRAPDALRASVSGAYYLAWGLGYFLGPLLVAQLGERAHPQAGYHLLALLMVLQAGLLCLVRVAERRRE